MEWIIGLKRSFSAKKLQVMKIGSQKPVMTKLKKCINFSPVWKKNGAPVSKALVGDEVTLCANTHNIADGTSATIKIVEKDADGNDDDVATLKAAVQNNKIECSWKVVYTADDDDADSKKEQEEKGYTLPEYAFSVECDDVESEESPQLDVRGWISITFNEEDAQFLQNAALYLYSGNRKSNTVIINDGKIFFKDLPLLSKGKSWEIGVDV